MPVTSASVDAEDEDVMTREGDGGLSQQHSENHNFLSLYYGHQCAL